MQSEKVIVGSFGSTLARDDTSLPEGALSGEARLRELEHLLRTASDVKSQAERELMNSTATHEAARQRIAAAERMQRKAEQELVRLRTELAREALHAGKCWSPGDPLQENRPQVNSGGGDFEVAMLTGTPRPVMGSGQVPLSIREETPAPVATAPTPPRTGTAHRAHRRRNGIRTLTLAFIVMLGAGLGAAATFFTVQSPEIRARIQTLPEQIRPLLQTPLQGKVAAERPAIGAAPAVATPATAAPAPEVDRAARQRAWQAAIAAEEARLRRAAERDYARRLAALQLQQ